ncbi:MAG TPA: L-ribulose-5-phosphate 4-epimerase AraD [Chthoniobacterales bacterium]
MSAYSELKEECYAANLLLPEYKLIELAFGNVSVSDPRHGVFAIRPGNVDHKALRPDQMLVVDFDGQVIHGSLRPSADTATHQRLFQAFPDIRSIVHTHSRNAVAFAQAGRPIPCFGTTHADYFCGEIPVTRPISPEEVQNSYDHEIGNVIVERFKDLDPHKVKAVLVHGHAPFVWGSSGTEAVENAFALEVIAEIALKTLEVNSGASPIQQSLVDRHYQRKHGETV